MLSTEGEDRDAALLREPDLAFPICSDIDLCINFFLKFFFSTFIYFWDRERQSMNGGGAEREGDTESETGSRL